MPASIRSLYTRSNKGQIEPYDLYNVKLKTAIDEKRYIIIVGDDNINTFEPDLNTMDSHSKNVYIKLTEQLEDNSLVVHNFDPTHGLINGKKSTIDHVYSKCPLKMINIQILTVIFLTITC